MDTPKKQGWYERFYEDRNDWFLDYWHGEWYTGDTPKRGGCLAEHQDLPWRAANVKTERFTGDIL